jgi:predicted SprT family Zn-dependent metalloprotease
MKRLKPPTKDDLRDMLAKAARRSRNITYTIKCSCGHLGRMDVKPRDLDRSFVCSKCGKERWKSI